MVLNYKNANIITIVDALEFLIDFNEPVIVDGSSGGGDSSPLRERNKAKRVPYCYFPCYLIDGKFHQSPVTKESVAYKCVLKGLRFIKKHKRCVVRSYIQGLLIRSLQQAECRVHGVDICGRLVVDIMLTINDDTINLRDKLIKEYPSMFVLV